MQKKARQILGVSINPHLYEKLKKECSGKNVSAFVEKAIAKELEEKEKQRKEFQQKLIASYKRVAKNNKLQKEVEIWDETLNDAWNAEHCRRPNAKYSRRAKKNE